MWTPTQRIVTGRTVLRPLSVTTGTSSRQLSALEIMKLRGADPREVLH